MSGPSGLPFDPGVTPNVETTRDALKRDSIPEQYRQTGERTAPPLSGRGWESWLEQTLPLLVLLAVLRITIPFLYSIRWSSLLGEASGWLRILLLAVCAYAIKLVYPVVRDILSGWRTASTTVVPRWLLLGFAFVLPTPLWALLILLASFAFAAQLAARVVHHASAWFRVRSGSDDPVEDPVIELWQEPEQASGFRSIPALFRTQLPAPGQVPKSELVERQNYNRGVLVLAASLAVGAAILVLSTNLVRGGFFAVLAMFSCLAVYAWMNLDEYRKSYGLSWSEVRTSLQDARDSWNHYGRNQTQAVDAWASPIGSSDRRRALLRQTFRFFTVAVLLLASYFPVVSVMTGSSVLDRTQTAVARTVGDWSYERQKGDLSSAVVRGLKNRGVEFGSEGYADAHRQTRTLLREAARERWTIRHRSEPEGWMKLSALALYFDAGKWHYALVGLAFGLVASLYLPGILFQVLLVALLGRALLHHSRRWGEARQVEERVGVSEWERTRAAAARANPEMVKDHVLLGRRLETDEKRWVHRETIHHHAHIVGSTGAGKTSRMLSPFVHQLADGNSSIVVFDLKGDPALFEEARLSAKRHNLGFRWFTTEPNRSTFGFNPLNQSHLRDFPGLSLATIYNSALGLEFGPGYGRSHFSEQNMQLLTRLLVQAETSIQSFRDLEAELQLRLKESGGKRSGRKRSRERAPLFRTPRQQDASLDLEAKVWKLGLLEALNVRPGEQFGGALPNDKLASINRHAIDMVDVVRHPQVLYFNLPSSLSSSIDREVGRLALFSLLTASQVTHDSQRRQVYVVIDEFQELVSAEIRKFFDQARNKRIAIIAANQSDAQLDAVDRTVRRAIADNVGLRVDFSANDLQSRADLVDLSGEAYYTEESFGTQFGQSSNSEGVDTNSWSESHSASQKIGPRYRMNDIAGFSAEDGHCVVWEKQNRGLGQFGGLPDPVEAYFHISKEDFEARSQARWPLDIDHPGAFDTPLRPLSESEQEPSESEVTKEAEKKSQPKPEAAKALQKKLNQLRPPDSHDS